MKSIGSKVVQVIQSDTVPKGATAFSIVTYTQQDVLQQQYTLTASQLLE
jgi:hypothetical protein